MLTALSLDSFLKKQLSSSLENNKIIFFQGETEYPLLFFSFIFQKLKKESNLYIKILDCALIEKSEIIKQCLTNFLGQKTVYWLKNIHQCTSEDKNKLLKFLQKYNGENKIIFFDFHKSNNYQGKNFDCVVTLPDKINQKIMIQLLEKQGSLNSFVSKKNIGLLFKKYKIISLDIACLFLHYSLIIGNNIEDFIKNYEYIFVTQDYSLFLISQYFFKKDSTQFFSYWKKIYSNYSLQFWIIFWSEQVWRACNFIQSMNNKQFMEAKRIGFRLPFSFLQKDYKKIDYKKLILLQQKLYDFDYAIKNGSSEMGLEVIFVTFFVS